MVCAGRRPTVAAALLPALRATMIGLSMLVLPDWWRLSSQWDSRSRSTGERQHYSFVRSLLLKVWSSEGRQMGVGTDGLTVQACFSMGQVGRH